MPPDDFTTPEPWTDAELLNLASDDVLNDTQSIQFRAAAEVIRSQIRLSTLVDFDMVEVYVLRPVIATYLAPANPGWDFILRENPLQAEWCVMRLSGVMIEALKESDLLELIMPGADSSQVSTKDVVLAFVMALIESSFS